VNAGAASNIRWLDRTRTRFRLRVPAFAAAPSGVSANSPSFPVWTVLDGVKPPEQFTEVVVGLKETVLLHVDSGGNFCGFNRHFPETIGAKESYSPCRSRVRLVCSPCPSR